MCKLLRKLGVMFSYSFWAVFSTRTTDIYSIPYNQYFVMKKTLPEDSENNRFIWFDGDVLLCKSGISVLENPLMFTEETSPFRVIFLIIFYLRFE